MIKAEPLTAFAPDAEMLLFPYSAEEFMRARPYLEEVLKHSEAAWAIYAKDELLCYAGVVRPTFLSTPVLWLMLGKCLSRRTARAYRYLTTLVRQRYPGAQVVIEDRWRIGERFAEFCGFSPLSQTVMVEGKLYRYYEVR